MINNVINEGLSEKTIRLFEQIPYPIIIHQEGRIVEANSEAVLLSKVALKTDLIGANILTFLSEPSRVKATELMASEEAYGCELFELIDQQQGYRYVEIKKSYFEDNAHRFTFLMIKDITEYRRGLITAANIQKATMMSKAPFGEALTVECGYYPKDIVSGDFYYFSHCESGFMTGILGDVKGNGISASLNTSAMKILFHESTSQCVRTKDVAKTMNEGIIRLLGEEFVAAIIFQFDMVNKKLYVSGAGISEFLHRSANGNVEKHIIKGPFLGMFEEELFEHKSFQLNAGEEYYFYSDGLEMAGIDVHIEALEEASNFEDRNALIGSLCLEGPEDDKTWVAIKIN